MEKAADVRQERHPLRDREVVDVVVQRGDVEVSGRRLPADVALVDPDALGQPPRSHVVAREGDDLGLEVEAECVQPRIALRGVTDVHAAAASDLQQAHGAVGRDRVLHRLSHERLERARRARDQVARHVCEL